MPFRPSVLLFPALLGLTQCIMEPGPAPKEKMPAATQTGANTAGCVVDGLTWVPRNNGQTMGGQPLPAVEAKWRTVTGGRHPLALVLVKNIDDRTHVHGETGLQLWPWLKV